MKSLCGKTTRVTSSKLRLLVRDFKISLKDLFWSTRPTTVPDGSDHYFRTCCPSVPNLQNQLWKSHPVGIVGWPSGSLKTCFSFFIIFDAVFLVSFITAAYIEVLQNIENDTKLNAIFWRYWVLIEGAISCKQEKCNEKI